MSLDPENTGQETTLPRPGWFIITLAFISVAALFLRLYAAGDNFWLDEIIVYFLAMNDTHSLCDIFTGIRIEHHFLVTLEMWLAGDRLNWLWYRLPSVLTGTGMVFLVAIIAAGRMRLGATLAVSVMTAVSYPLVVYSSEARGYVPAAFFALFAFLALDSWLTRRKWISLAGYWFTIITAVLYHSTAVCVFLSLALWSVVREFRKNNGLTITARNLIFCHGPPFFVFGLLYITVMRKWQTMGGDILPLVQVIKDTVSLAMGFPMGTAFGTFILSGTLILVLLVLWLIKEHLHSSYWIFYIALLVVTPAIMLVSSNRQYVYVRYFLIMFPFFYLMLGEGLDQLATRRPILGVAAIFVAAWIITGNGILTLDFMRVGRGGYLEAVQYMADKTPWPEITVSGDHDFRNETTIRFYSRYLPPGRRIVYLKLADWPASGPDWSIIQTSCMESYVPEKTVRARGGTYTLMKSYPCGTLSGLSWHIYRNDTKFAGKIDLNRKQY